MLSPPADPGDGDVGRVAPERCDVGLYPAKRLDLVQEAIVAGDPQRRLGAEGRMGQIAEHAQAIVDRHHDDAARGQPGAVIDALAPRARRQRSAVNPDHDGRIVRVSVRPDIQRQAVFAHGRRIVGVDVAGAGQGLEAGGTEPGRIPHARPSRHRLGRCPARGACRRRGVGQALEHVQRAFGPAHRGAGRGVHHRAGLGVGWGGEGQDDRARQAADHTLEQFHAVSPVLASSFRSTRATQTNSPMARA
jgi:hypothetical protein